MFRYNPSKKIVKPNNLRVLGERKPNDLKHDSQNPSTVEFIYNRLVTKSGLERSKDKSPVPSLFKQCICEGLLRFFYFEIRLITKRILNPNNIFITQNLHDITKKIAEQANRLLVFRYVRTITY